MAQTQPFGFSCVGGLNINRSSFALQQEAGTATTLINFEVDSDGGYRRINGFTPLAVSGDLYGRVKTTVASDGGSEDTTFEDKILGILGYSSGGIVCSGHDVFYTPDGVSYVRLNRSGATGGLAHSSFISQSVVDRTNQNQTDFTIFESTAQNDEVIICDGANKPLRIKITHTTDTTLGNSTFTVNEIAVDTDKTPAFGIMHEKRFVVSGVPNLENTIYYSDTLDPNTFSGGGSLSLEDKVVGLKSFRGNIIVFCKTSIFKLINIGDGSNQALVPITTNIGCVSRESIQEVGGDLIFLASDGLRTIAGTERLDDTELGTVSRPIQQLIVKEIVSKVNELIISSVVIRQSNQYRLFYCPSTASGATNTEALKTEDLKEGKGIIGTLTSNGFSWSEIHGMQATAIEAIVSTNGLETIYHGDRFGTINVHNTKNHFAYRAVANDIDAIYETPFLDLGDMGTQKTFTYVNVALEPEGPVSPKLLLTYGEEKFSALQPSEVTLPEVSVGSQFGDAKFSTGSSGAFRFGALDSPLIRQAVQGSGNTVRFRIRSTDQKDPYTVQGLYVNYYPSGRR